MEMVTYRLPSENTPMSCNFLALSVWRRHRNGIGRHSATISVRAFSEPKTMKAVLRWMQTPCTVRFHDALNLNINVR